MYILCIYIYIDGWGVVNLVEGKDVILMVKINNKGSIGGTKQAVRCG